MLKILHVLHHSFPLTTGYSVRSHHVLQSQARAGIQISALTLPFQETRGRPYHKVADITYRHLKPDASYKISGLRIFTKIFNLKTEIIRLCNKTKPDVIHAHSPSIVGLAALLAARKCNCALIYEMRGLWEETGLAISSEKDRLQRMLSIIDAQIQRSIENHLLPHANMIIVISNALKKHVKNKHYLIGSNKITVIPNGVEAHHFIPRPKDRKLARELKIGNEVVIGYISSIRKIEGLDYLIHAIKKLQDKNVKLLVVGNGEELPSLIEMSKKLDLQSKVIFTGSVPYDQIGNYYSLIDIFTVPRRQSYVCQVVTPLKPLEAMAMGKCLLISNVGGLLELVKPGETGMIFKSENIGDLAAKLDFLICNEKLRKKLSNNARDYVVDNHLWDHLIKKYINIYTQLAFKHGKYYS